MEALDGIENVETDCHKKSCTFVLSKPDVDYKTQLTKLADEGGLLEGYTVQ